MELLAINMIGLRFNKLIIIDQLPNHPTAGKQWLCKCDCGETRVSSLGDLKRNFVQQCKSCRSKQLSNRNLIHGHAYRKKHSSTYYSWSSMLSRVRNPNRKQAKDYILRGITVCNEWLDFNIFLKDMGERPKGKTLDRIDNDKGYSPVNCRWATSKEQNNNRRKPQIE